MKIFPALAATCLATTLLGGSTVSLAEELAKSSPTTASRGRVTIKETDLGFVVRDDQGGLLRGNSATLSKAATDRGERKFIYDTGYWDRQVAGGLNAYRIAWFDPWYRAHGTPGDTKPWPHHDMSIPEQRQAVLDEFDFIVDQAEKRGMYVLINYHNTGGYRDPDHSKPASKNKIFEYQETMNDLILFWKTVAPRYANRTHVFYEPLNEYVQWRPDHFTDEHLADTKKIHDIIRKAAPDTHIVLLSFANHQPVDSTKHSMLTVARRLKAMGVDFSNASVAFHPYNPKSDQPNTSKYIRELMREFPVINTEQNFPVKSIPELDWLDAVGMEGDRMGVQSMERLGISWFHWNTENEQRFQDYYLDILVKDAKEKGYYWKED